jgi:hypothetical protein
VVVKRRDIQSPVSVKKIASLAVAAMVARLFLEIIDWVQDSINAQGTIKVFHLRRGG